MPASGRFDLFANPSANGRNLRIPAIYFNFTRPVTIVLKIAIPYAPMPALGQLEGAP
jgi:hypothetical protein